MKQLIAHPLRNLGFTLIEMLVVLVIVGVMLVGVVVKIAPDERQILQQEASRLGLLLEQARDQSFLTGRSIAWSADNETYRFWQLNAERQWTLISDQPLFRARQFPTNVRLSALTINQVKMPLNERLIFSPSGLNMPFEALLVVQDRRIRLVGDSAGRVKVFDEN